MLFIETYLYPLSLLIFTTLAMKYQIINGTEVLPDEYPFMVSVQYKYNHICGGTILNRRCILTAAHCVTKKESEKLKVRLTDGNRIQVQSVKCHENYTKVGRNDIAIAILEIEVPKTFEAVNLAKPDFSTKADTPGLLVSWGHTEYNTFSNSLQLTTVVIYNDLSCSSKYDMNKNMCAGPSHNFSASCKGDSGGPLLVNGSQVGIISFGSKSCTDFSRNQPKILTRVSTYLEWIDRNNPASSTPRAFPPFKAVAFFVILSLFY